MLFAFFTEKQPRETQVLMPSFQFTLPKCLSLHSHLTHKEGLKTPSLTHKRELLIKALSNINLLPSWILHPPSQIRRVSCLYHTMLENDSICYPTMTYYSALLLRITSLPLAAFFFFFFFRIQLKRAYLDPSIFKALTMFILWRKGKAWKSIASQSRWGWWEQRKQRVGSSPRMKAWSLRRENWWRKWCAIA